MRRTLLREASPLAHAAAQRRLLEAERGLPEFREKLADAGREPLTAAGIDVLQVNVGKLCNQTCHHCHVDAGPDRRESMSRETAELCLDVLQRGRIPVLDITGGAPEMNPHFRQLVQGAHRLGCRMIDRCNLTILAAPGYEDLPEFLAEHDVEIVASLPCYLETNVDRQRGDHVFQRSLRSLHRLNDLGYGSSDRHRLTLVYNPIGPSLPPVQERLEADYRRELRSRHGVEFTRLYTITNMPLGRFLDDLQQTGRLDDYLRLLVQAFHPDNVSGLMCRSMLSVDWQGNLFDCDFNQMLALRLPTGGPRHLRDLDESALRRLAQRPIVTGRHCFGCTAGAGSSCGGQLRTS